MKKQLFVALLLIASAAIWFGCKDKEEEYTGSISGIVTDKATGEPIKNAGVELKPSGKNTVTGSDGQFEFVDIELGEYTLFATKTGYNDGESSKITVTARQTAHCDIQMEKLPYVVLNTLPITEVKTTSAKFNGVITDAGSNTYTERGFVYSESSMPTLENTIHRLTSPVTEETNYSAIATGLTIGHTYYVRAYAINAAGTAYSTNQVSVMPNYVLPTVTTNDVSGISPSNGTATLNGTIDDMGDPIYTERGFAYGTGHNPSIEDDNKKEVIGISLGAYQTNITGLQIGYTYYVRAYAINIAGVSYGDEVPLYLNAQLPVVSIQNVTNIDFQNKTATLNGTIESVGDPAYTERGFVYGTMDTPSIYDATAVTVAETVTGSFSKIINGLQDQRYNVRAYAKNSEGDVSYSSVVSFQMETAKLCSGCGPGGSSLWVAISDAGSFTWGPRAWTNANSESDGMYNMDKAKSKDPTLVSYQAFKACDDRGIGWYLPSKNELGKLYEHNNDIGGFNYNMYWSSTDYDDGNMGAANKAWIANFEEGAYGNAVKDNSILGVRCVRRVE